MLSSICKNFGLTIRYAFPALASVAIVLLMPGSVRAQTSAILTFNDLTDTLSLSGASRVDITSFGCGAPGTQNIATPIPFFPNVSGENCRAIIRGPASTGNLLDTTFSPCLTTPFSCLTFIGGENGTISDVMLVQGCTSGTGECADVIFVSDAGEGTLGGFGVACSDIAFYGYACTSETGSSQLGT